MQGHPTIMTENDIEKAYNQIKRGYSIKLVAKLNSVGVPKLKKTLSCYYGGILPLSKKIPQKIIKIQKEFTLSPYVVPGIKKTLMPADINGVSVAYDKEYIIDTILEYRKQKREFVFIKCREREITYTRQLIAFFIKKYTRLSLKSIGCFLSQDHTTIIHSLRAINKLSFSDPKTQTDIHNIKQLL